MFPDFEFDEEFAGDLYDAVMDAFEVDHSDAEGMVMAKYGDIEDLYQSDVSVPEIMEIVFNITDY